MSTAPIPAASRHPRTSPPRSISDKLQSYGPDRTIAGTESRLGKSIEDQSTTNRCPSARYGQKAKRKQLLSPRPSKILCGACRPKLEEFPRGVFCIARDE